MARRIEVEIIGDARSLERAFGRAKTHTSAFGNSLRTLGKASLYAGAALATGVVVGLEKSIHASIAAQASQARLRQAFKDAHVELKPYIGDLTKVETASRKLGFTDTMVRDSLGSLIVATHNYKKAATDLAVAQDLSRFKHIGLSDATKMLTMAMTGSQRAAKQLGITVIPLTTNVDKLKASHVNLKTALGHSLLAEAKLQDKMLLGQRIIDEVTAKTHGQAKVFSQTAAGSMERFKAQFEHLKVTIGDVFLPIFVKLVDKLNVWMARLQASKKFHEDLQRGIEIVKTAFNDLKAPVESAIGLLKSFGSGIASMRSALGPDIFSGLIIGIVGAAGALSAIAKLQKAFMAMTAFAGGAGPLGLALLGLTLAIGGIAAAFIHNRSAADSVSAAYKRVANSAKDLRDAEQNLKQSELNVASAHLRQKQAADEVYNAQVAYNTAVRDFGVHSHAAIEASHNLTAAKLGLKQADLDAAAAVRANQQAEQARSDAVRNTTDNILRAADSQRHYQSTLGAVNSTLSRVTGGFWDMKAGVQSASEKADAFARNMENIAAHTSKLNPRLRGAYEAVAALARAIHDVPSDMTIRFIVKTLTFTPGTSPRGGPFQGGGHAAGGRIPGAPAMADSVPAMLSPGEFVVTGGGEKLLESMTFPGVLNWLQQVQPRHFAAGGRIANETKTVEFDRMFKTAPSGAGPGGRSAPAGQVRNWLLQALKSTGLYSSRNLNDLYQQTMHESGGNPGSINLWDSNALAGHPSKGLLQVIDSTFSSYKLPGHNDIWNPVDNAIAAMRYMVAKYGSIDAATRQRGFIGYAAGGRVRHRKPKKPSIGHLPTAIGIAKAKAAGTPGLADDLAALNREEAWIDEQLQRRDLSPTQLGSLRIKEIGIENRIHKLQARLTKAPTPKVPISIQAGIARAAGTTGLGDDIKALNRERIWLLHELRRKDLSPAQKGALKLKLIGVENKIRKDEAKRAKAEAKDYSTLPAQIQYDIARSHLTEDTADDLPPLREAEAWLLKQLQRKGLTLPQKTAIIDALVGIRSQIETITGSSGATGTAVSPDAQAMIDQANDRAAVAQRSADLANAFVSTGVFAGDAGSGGAAAAPPGAPGAPTIIFQHLIPDTQQIIRAAGQIVSGFDMQGYTPASVYGLGV